MSETKEGVRPITPKAPETFNDSVSYNTTESYKKTSVTAFENNQHGKYIIPCADEVD